MSPHRARRIVTVAVVSKAENRLSGGAYGGVEPRECSQHRGVVRRWYEEGRLLGCRAHLCTATSARALQPRA